MNKQAAHTSVTRKDVSAAFAELMPQMMRGVQLDLFVARGITQTQFLVLGAVRGHTRCSMSTLAHNLHVSLPTATGIVDRLVKAGLVRRSPQADDRRQVIVELTAKGEAFFRDVQAVIRQRWEEVLVSLNPEELTAFHDVVTKLLTHLKEAA